MGDSSDSISALMSPNQSSQDFALRNLDAYRESPDRSLRYAQFTLSVSDTDSIHTNRTSSRSSLEDINLEVDNQQNQTAIKPGNLQLSLILGISEDEKAENRLANAAVLQAAAGNTATFSEDNEFEYLRDKNLRKCISLKSNKTPPSTPGKKKAVRFADALGLDLASIRHVIDMDEPPIVPESAMRNLNLDEERSSANETNFIQVRKLCICFSSPDNSPDFLRRVQERKVVLENCFVDDHKSLVYGKIRVMNMAFHKVVNIRYTMNGWLTYTDVAAVYDSGSNDGATDKFSYSVHIPEYFQFGNSMEFSVMFVSSNQIFWDNNYGSNYRIECYIANEPSKLF